MLIKQNIKRWMRVVALAMIVAVLAAGPARAAEARAQSDSAAVGSVAASGQNSYGQLGDGTKNGANTPVGVKNLDGADDMNAVAAGVFIARR